MSKADLLTKMGLTQAEFDDFVVKFSAFYKGLDANQQNFYRRVNEKTALQIAKSAAVTATTADVQTLFAQVPSSGGIYFLSCC